MTELGKAWCYLFNIWWEDSDNYLGEGEDEPETSS